MSNPSEILRQIAVNAKAVLLNTLKARRFTTTARVLGEKKALGVTVQVVNQPDGAAAWWDSIKKTIVLNDAMPNTSDSKLTLIWERAKLYHELFHVLFTTNESMRKELCYQSNNPDRYLWVSNALEDGRIEHHGGKLFGGTIWYIRTLLKHLVKSNSPDSGLLIYVRTKLWRNAKEKAFWSKYIPLIDEAITAQTSKTVWQNAFEIVQDMEQPQPKQDTPKGKPEPTDDEGEKQGQPQQSDEGDESEESEDDESEESDDDESGEGESMGESDEDSEDDSDESGDDEGDEDGDSEPSEPDPDAEDDSEGQSGGDESEGDGEAQETPAAPSAPPTSKQIDRETKSELEDIIDQAMQQIADEVEQEMIDIDAELAGYVQVQEYANETEAQHANELTEVFASLLVESNRQRYQQCKRGGTLDGRRLIETRTNGEFMHERVEKPSQPHIVLLIDESYSMRGDRHAVSIAARMLNGAIQESGARSCNISFGAGSYCMERYAPRSVVPVEGFECNEGNTPTGLGLSAAHQWLQQQDARRGMVIVITDGIPTDGTNSQVEFENLRNDGFYVLDVLIGKQSQHPTLAEKVKLMSHDSVYCENSADLVRILEEPLGNFMCGAF